MDEIESKQPSRIVPLKSRNIPINLRFAANVTLITEAFKHPLRSSFIGVDLDNRSIVVK